MDINQHCENEAVVRCPAVFEMLDEYMSIWDQHSIVLMLQKPDSGGDIIIYNEKWVDIEQTVSQRAKLVELDKPETGGKGHINEIVTLNAGDILIFPAGNTWHKVSEAYGAKARITIGGFMGKAKAQNSTYLFWS